MQNLAIVHTPKEYVMVALRLDCFTASRFVDGRIGCNSGNNLLFLITKIIPERDL
jgi:hypothetical protein